MAFVGATAFALAAAIVTKERVARLRLAIGVTASAFLATAAFGMVSLLAGGDPAAAHERDLNHLTIFRQRPSDHVTFAASVSSAAAARARPVSRILSAAIATAASVPAEGVVL